MTVVEGHYYTINWEANSCSVTNILKTLESGIKTSNNYRQRMSGSMPYAWKYCLILAHFVLWILIQTSMCCHLNFKATNQHCLVHRPHFLEHLHFYPYWDQVWASDTLDLAAAVGGRMTQLRSSGIDACWYLLLFRGLVWNRKTCCISVQLYPHTLDRFVAVGWKLTLPAAVGGGIGQI